MAFGKRRRIEPAAAGDTHNTACMQGLGASADTDAEATATVGDRLSFLDANRLLNNAGTGQVESAWLACADHSLLRITVEYRAGTGTRTFIVAMAGHDGRVIYSRVYEPDNSGISISGDVIVGGNFKANSNGLDNLNCLGMLSYKLILLAQGGGVAVDAWGGIA